MSTDATRFYGKSYGPLEAFFPTFSVEEKKKKKKKEKEKKRLIIPADTPFAIHRFNFLRRIHARRERFTHATHGRTQQLFHTAWSTTRVCVCALTAARRLALGAATTGRWG